ncbi:hypothetical protein PIB30_084637, partial [Stylosanthes scabra]|nr:hypothetical protein [Stylosanthes scabra]
ASERYSNCKHRLFSTYEDAVKYMERTDIEVDAGAEEVPLMVQPIATFGINGMGRVEGGEMPAVAAAHDTGGASICSWQIRPWSELTRSMNNLLEPAPTLCHLGHPLQQYNVTPPLHD